MLDIGLVRHKLTVETKSLVMHINTRILGILYLPLLNSTMLVTRFHICFDKFLL